MLTQLMRGISMANMELKQIIFRSPSEGKTELWQNDELTRFLQSMMVTAERIQENLTQLMVGHRRGKGGKELSWERIGCYQQMDSSSGLVWIVWYPRDWWSVGRFYILDEYRASTGNTRGLYSTLKLLINRWIGAWKKKRLKISLRLL